MKQMLRSLFFFSFPLCSIASLLAVTTANAQQVIPDNTLGSESSIVNTNVDVKGSPGDRIDGGATRGTNLFHSFEKFNVDPNGRVYFNPQNGIQNIFSRVTGGNPSNIQGTLGVLTSDANLFFINPNGILFGPNARLDVGGSFFASTAESILFDGFEFSSTNAQAPSPTLNINIPIGLRFRDNPSPITVQGPGQNLGSQTLESQILEAPQPLLRNLENTNLQVRPGRTLALVGGNVTLNGGVVRAPRGQVELGGLAAQGTVGLKDNTLIFPQGVQRANVSLTNRAGIDVIVDNQSGGSIAINARDINISDRSFLASGIIVNENSGTLNLSAGDIKLDATGKTTIDRSQIVSNVNPGISGNTGNIRISTDSLSSTAKSRLNTSMSGQGNAGNVIINARGDVSFDDSRVDTSVATRQEFMGGSIAKGTGGDIRITAPTLRLLNKSALFSANNYAQGNAGNIILDASNSIQFASESSANSSLRSESSANSSLKIIGQGNGGNIEIKTGVLSLTNGGKLFADTDGIGNAGSVIINADQVELVGANSGIFNWVQQNAQGNGGEIRINTNSFIAKDGAGLFTFINGKGDGANVIIDAKERVTFDGGVEFNTNSVLGIVQSNAVGNAGAILIKTKLLELTNGARFNTSITQNGKGKGGNIELTTDVFSLTNGGQLLADTDGIGDAGNVIINANRVELDGAVPNFGSGIFSRVLDKAEGNGGEIRINTNSFVAKNGAQVFADVRGKGNGANVIINAEERVTFDGRIVQFPSFGQLLDLNSGVLSVVQPTGKGNGGNIRINTKLLEVTNGARLDTTSSENGSPGNIIIDARDRILVQNTQDFSRSATSGIFGITGGNNNPNKPQEIRITTPELSLVGNTQINTSTGGQNIAGNVIIDTGSLSLSRGARILAGVGMDARGTAGSITITSKTLSVENPGSGIVVSSEGTGKAGDITIVAESLTLNDKAIIAADTRGTEGGNITLNLRDVLRLRQQSRISTSAGDEESGGISSGNAGNININVPLIVAFPENNDITANAEGGSGGNVRIRAQSLFGIASLSRRELARRLNTEDPNRLDPANLPTSDITAISQQQPRLDGIVQLNTPDIDPNRGLVELPEEVVDPTQQVAQNPCQRGVGSTFVVTGRSGLPPSPTQSLSSHNARVSLLEPVASTAVSATPTQLTSPSTTPSVQQLIPAQGWVRNEKGKVVLTAYNHTTIGSQRSLQSRTGCLAR